MYQNKKEARRWEDMNTDCLVNIFGRLDIESRVFDVPFVCKNWHRALSNPLCWKTLVFPYIFESRLSALIARRGYSISGLIKFVVDRSQGCAVELVLTFYTTSADLVYVSDACPALKVLTLPSFNYPDINVDFLSKLVVKWKSLEILKLGRCYGLVQTIDNISKHCKNFVGLHVGQSEIDNAVASAIVSKLETIKLLVLDGSKIEKKDLVLILKCCKQLELLHALKCEGFDEDDNEILNCASHIKDFCCDGSKTNMHEGEDYYNHFECDCCGMSSDDEDAGFTDLYIDYYSL